MRIQVVGDSPVVDELIGLLRLGGYAASRTEGMYSFHIDELKIPLCTTCRTVKSPIDYIIIDGVDCQLEQLATNYIQELGVPKIVLDRAGANRSDRRLEIKTPNSYTDAVSLGLYRAIDKMLNKSSEEVVIPKKRGRFFGLLSLLFATFISVTSYAQDQNSIIRFWNPTLDAIVAAGDVANNALRVNMVAGTISGADGSILDGVTPAIKATVADYGSGNPLLVMMSQPNMDGVPINFTTDFDTALPTHGWPIGGQDFGAFRSAFVYDVDTTAGGEYVFGVSLRKVTGGTSVEFGTTANPFGAQISDGTDTALVSGTGALNVTCDNCGGSTFADDDAFTGGTTPVLNIGALYDTSPPSVTDGSAGIPRMNASRQLLVDGSGVTQPVSGSVTANAGTNLNTSLLALESGGNLATAASAVHAEDTGHVSGHFGTLSLGVRNEDNVDFTGTDGEYVPIAVDAKGHVFIRPGDEILNIAIDQTGANNAVDVLTMPTTTVTATNLDVQIGGSDTVTVTGSVTASDPTYTDATGSTVPANAAFVAGTDGTNTRALKTDTGGELQIDVLSAPTTAVTGTFWQTIQPISIDQTGSNNAVDVLTMPTTTVTATDLDIRNLTATDVVTVTLPDEGQQTAANSISTTLDTDNDSVGPAGAAPPGEYTAIGAVTSGATGGFLAGITVCNAHASVDIVTATSTLIVTGVASRHVYICSINLVTAAANNVALVAGTDATCSTSTAGIAGGATAAEGWNFAANGGIAQGSGFGAIASTNGPTGAATGDSVCLITSAATQLSGSISYAIY